MKRICSIAISLFLTGILIAGVYIVILPQLNAEPAIEWEGFEWGVSTIDSFLYEVRAWAVVGVGILAADVERHLTLNGTTINMTIINLPSLADIRNLTAFEKFIINVLKTDYAFINGTDVDDYYPFGRQSWWYCFPCCILPIGNWSLMDSYYPDQLAADWNSTIGVGIYEEKYTNSLFADRFQFKMEWFVESDSGGMWSCNDTLTKGVPSNFVWRYTHQDASLYINLSLIE